MDREVEIVLVDDDPADVELAIHALRENKLANHIEVLRDGEEALAFLLGDGPASMRHRQRRPRLILLDLKLPKVDGIEVLRHLKSEELTRSIPVVILTSSREERDVCKGYELGVNSYIQKPIDFDQFRTIIKQVGLYWLAINLPPVIPVLTEKVS
jgi:two-component system response regulator